MMAGVASAITNNNIGIAGTSPDGFLMPIKACTPPQSANVDLCPVSHVVRAINFATDRGARIISMSIGYARQDLTNLQKSSIRRSCDRANRRGALVLTSAGNANSPGAEYPAAFRSVVGVGGTMQDVFTTLPGGGMPEIRWDETSLGAPDEGSNYGEGVELAAPAQHIHMTAPTYETDFYAWEQCVDPATQQPLSLIRRQQEGCYISASGTSPSTAIVAGVADLVRGRFSDITVDDLRYRLSATATRLPGQELGSGMVNAYEAVLNGSFEGEGHIPYGLREAVADYADYLDYVNDCIEIGGECAHIVFPVTGANNKPPADYGWHFLGYSGVGYGWSSTGSTDKRWCNFGEGGAFDYSLGPIKPIHGERFAWLTTGRANETEQSIYEGDMRHWDYAYYATVLEQRFKVGPEVNMLNFSFFYNMLTEEEDREGFGMAPDIFLAYLVINGERKALTYLDLQDPVINSSLTEVSGLHFSEGTPVQQTGWIPISHPAVTVKNKVPDTPSDVIIRFIVFDAWDRSHDTMVLLDWVKIEGFE
jgi:hypothetical protein